VTRQDSRPGPHRLVAIAVASVVGATTALWVDWLAAADESSPGWSALVYRSDLALVVAAVATIAAALVAGLRRAPFAALRVIVGTASGFRPATRLSASEHLAELGVPSALTFGTTLAVAVAFVIAIGALAVRRDGARVRVVLFGLGVAFGLGALRIPQTYFDLKLLVLIAQTSVVAASVEPVLRASPRFARVAMAALVFSPIVATLVAADAIGDARQNARARRGFAARLDALVTPADAAVLRMAHLDVDAVDLRRCTVDHGVAAPPTQMPNFVVVSIDALRRDALGRRVRGRSVTPALDALAMRASVPSSATTQYAATLFSLASAYTGRSPTGIVMSPTPPPTVLSLLAARGEHAVFILPAGPFFDRPTFATYLTQSVRQRRAEDAQSTVDAVLDEIASARRANRRFVVAAHVVEPHDPYEPHPGFAFGDDTVGRYLGEVAFVDGAMGRLIDAMTERGDLDDTVLIVFADHGEALGERGHLGHHLFVSRWISDIPFFVLAPRSAGAVAADIVEPSDIGVTIARARGLTVPFASGRDLFSAPSGERITFAESFPNSSPELARFATEAATDLAELRRRAAIVDDGFGYSAYAPLVSVTSARYRLIVGRRDGVVELYDRARDPSETNDLSRDRPDVRRTLLAHLARHSREESTASRCALERSERSR